MNPVKAMFSTTDQAFPHGTVATGFLLTLTQIVDTPPANPDGSPGTPSDPIIKTGRAAIDAREITIDDVPVGIYRGKVALVANDAELAPAVEDPAPIVIADVSPVSLPIPSSLSLTRP